MPGRWIPIPRQLDAVAVGIVEVDSFVRAVIRRPADRPTVINQSLEDAGQIDALRVVDREMVETGRATRRPRPSCALPCVQAEVMMVPTRGKKRRLISVAGGFLKSEQVTIKGNRTFEIGDLEMHVSNARIRRGRVLSSLVHWVTIH